MNKILENVLKLLIDKTVQDIKMQIEYLKGSYATDNVVSPCYLLLISNSEKYIHTNRHIYI